MGSAEGLTLHLRVTPNAGRDRVDGFETRANDDVVRRLRVAAAPDKGKANQAVIALLARALDVPRSAVTLLRGDTARLKTVHVAGDARLLAQRLAAHDA